MSHFDDDFGGLDDIFVPRDPDTGDPLPSGPDDEVDEDELEEEWPDEDDDED